jgi:hypothetical protein
VWSSCSLAGMFPPDNIHAAVLVSVYTPPSLGQM